MASRVLQARRVWAVLLVPTEQAACPARTEPPERPGRQARQVRRGRQDKRAPQALPAHTARAMVTIIVKRCEEVDYSLEASSGALALVP